MPVSFLLFFESVIGRLAWRLMASPGLPLQRRVGALIESDLRNRGKPIEPKKRAFPIALPLRLFDDPAGHLGRGLSCEQQLYWRAH
jgi:hypothetical protein